MSSGGGKGGGGSGIDEMLDYGNKALDLQKTQYEQTRADQQPWYSTGSAAVGQLGTLLGLKTQPKTISSDFENQYRAMYGVTNPKQFSSQIGQGLFYDSKTGKVGTSGDVSLGNIQSGNAGLDEALPGAQQKVNDYLAANYADNSGSADFGKLTQGFDLEKFGMDPGYQFRLDEGTKALDRQLNARGKTYSPEAAKALMGYNQDMGSQEYNNSFNRYNIENDNLFNRLATLSGFGQTASGQIANAGSNYANAGSDIYTGMGNSIAAQKQAQQANNSSMFGSLLGAGAQLGSAYMMSDERLKENITPIGKENGHNIYTYNYIGDNVPFIGVMAQEVMETHPEAVKLMDNGFYAVDYDKIGVKFRSAVSSH